MKSCECENACRVTRHPWSLEIGKLSVDNGNDDDDDNGGGDGNGCGWCWCCSNANLLFFVFGEEGNNGLKWVDSTATQIRISHLHGDNKNKQISPGNGLAAEICNNNHQSKNICSLSGGRKWDKLLVISHAQSRFPK